MRRASGFTLIETMIAACVLTIVLGLAVSLSRHVRGQSAKTLTYDVLARLETMLRNYSAANGGAVPVVAGLGDPSQWSGSGADLEGAEAAVYRQAVRNNEQLIAALKPFAPNEMHGLPLSVFDPGGGEVTGGGVGGVRDAWGTPIVLDVKGALGNSPKGASAAFFVSAGADGKFLTRDDNLYSYETLPRGQ